MKIWIWKNGITLVSLVITIVVLVILSTVGISQGINVIRETKVNEFVGKLQIIQYKVNNLYEKGEDAL